MISCHSTRSFLVFFFRQPGPSSESKKRPAEKIKKVNQLYQAAVKGDAQVTLVETYPLFANADGDAKKEEFPDLLHPNEAGYAKWAQAIRPVLATLGFVETEMDDFKPEAGFVSLFNGKDLTGWGFKTNNFDGKSSSPDGRYVAKNGRLIVTTPPEYSRIQQLWTTKEFPKDFTLKLEFRATPNADSGVFIRRPQLQCRDYPLAGPYKELKNYQPQDWTEMVVVVKDGVAHCTCNGEVLEAALKVLETGPIGLEGDRGQMEYRDKDYRSQISAERLLLFAARHSYTERALESLGTPVLPCNRVSSVMLENTEVAILGRVFEAEKGDLSPPVAQSWLKLRLPDADELRLRELSARAKKEELSPAEVELLENYLQVGRLLDLMRSKARRSLQSKT